MPENSELLCKYSKEKIRHAKSLEKVCNALLNATAPMGKMTSLLGIGPDASPTHRATEETIILLGKLKEFWDAIEASLLKIGPGESLH